MNLKKVAAQKAVEYVESGMVLGLGTGSTTSYFVDLLGEKIQQGELSGIKGVPTSDRTAERAQKVGIPLTNLKDHPILNLAVDGADEVDPQLNLIKGLGRALLREKIVEIHAEQFVVIVDESKFVLKLGSHVPLPVEVVQFEIDAHVRWLASLGCRAELWLEENGAPVVTENGNFLVRCWFDHGEVAGIADPYGLAAQLDSRPGIVEHGLFLDMATEVIVAGKDGVNILRRKKSV